MKDGAKQVSTGSLYTTRKFEGLAIVIDTVGGVQKIRGFLNDGNTDFKSHHTVESLAFGHCDYAYRNLGRPSKLKIKYGSDGLSLTIDDKPCFSTPKVTLPADYVFGVTAASADPPDSFEIYKFAVSHGSKASSPPPPPPPTPKNEQNAKAGGNTQQPIASNKNSEGTLNTQFDSLNNRIQALSKTIDTLYSEVQTSRQVQKEILDLLRSSNVQGNIDSKLNNVDRLVSEIHRDVKATDHKNEYAKLNAKIEKTHESVTEHVPGRLRECPEPYTTNWIHRVLVHGFPKLLFGLLVMAEVSQEYDAEEVSMIRVG